MSPLMGRARCAQARIAARLDAARPLHIKESSLSASFVIFICSLWSMLINTGVRRRLGAREWLDVARTLEVGTLRRAFTIILPAAAPTILIGMRGTIGIAWLVTVAAEIRVGGTGIGYFAAEIGGSGFDRRNLPLVRPAVGRITFHSTVTTAQPGKDRIMKRSDLTEKILDIKRAKGWTWKYICDGVGGMSPMLVVGALLGQMKLTKPQAAKAGELFGLSATETAMLNEVPMRGTSMPPTDPLIYRFYELVMVNGPAWKAPIEEEFGDGIMSAIDFELQMERLPDPRGDRVRITMSGKFLPYKYYGASGNVPQYGYKEE